MERMNANSLTKLFELKLIAFTSSICRVLKLVMYIAQYIFGDPATECQSREYTPYQLRKKAVERIIQTDSEVEN